MSILNRPGDGIHSILIVLFKLLSPSKKMDRKRILAFCAPGEMSDEKTRQTLNTWIDLGLFLGEGDEVLIHPNIKVSDRKQEKLPALCRDLVMDSKNNKNFWESESNKSSDFTRGLCWMLAQDVWNVDFEGWDKAQTLMIKQWPAGKFVQNGTRWDGLKPWLVFLGFGWRGRYPNSVIVVDPTEAIRDQLPKIYGKKREMLASDLVTSLAANLPVLDGGQYRLLVEEKLRENTGPDAWVGVVDEGMISSSLSRALLRLEASGHLVGRLQSDFDTDRRVKLIGKSGGVIETYSHYKWNK